jgi:hypothetical protein
VAYLEFASRCLGDFDTFFDEMGYIPPELLRLLAVAVVVV